VSGFFPGGPASGGATGATGPTGPTGATGPTGPAGSANISGTTNRVVKFTGTTTGGDSGISDDGTTISTTEALTIQKDAITTTQVEAVTLQNETATTSGVQEQYSPMAKLRGRSWTGAADEIEEFAAQLQGLDGRVRVALLRRATGTGAWSTFGILDEQDATFGLNALTVGGVISSQSWGFRLSVNGGGLKESSGRAILQSASTTVGLLVDVGLATGDADTCVEILASAGTRSAGKYLSIGDGGGEVFAISSATATRGMVSVAALKLPEYTVAGVPSAVDFDNCAIIVSNEAGGRTIATSDGTNWRRVSDGAIIS
jgi:hypothetical protein